MGTRPEAARVRFVTRHALAGLLRRDHLRLAEAWLRGEFEVEGDFLEAVKVTEVIPPDPGLARRLLAALRLALRERRRHNRVSVAFHYDRPPEFLLPWLPGQRARAGCRTRLTSEAPSNERPSSSPATSGSPPKRPRAPSFAS